MRRNLLWGAAEFAREKELDMQDGESMTRVQRRGSKLVVNATSVAVLLLVLFFPAPASPQQAPRLERVGKTAGQGPQAIRNATVPNTAVRELLQVQKRRAIPFVPFPMLDPYTLKPVAPDAEIKLPNGKTITAKQFYEQVNSFESYLNGVGYSLRQAGFSIDLIHVPQNMGQLEEQMRLAPKQQLELVPRVNFMMNNSYRELSLERPVQVTPQTVTRFREFERLTPAERSSAAARLDAAHLNSNVHEGLVINSLALADLAKSKLGPLVKPPLPPPNPCTPLNKSRTWSWAFGDPAKFDSYVNGKLALNGEACKPANMQNFSQNNSKFSLSADGTAGGHVFHVGGDLLRFTGSMSGNEATNLVAANLGVFVLGQSVYSLNKSATAHWGIDDSVSKGVDFSTSFPIPVGPFDINVTIGAQGSVGFGYSLGLYPMYVSATAGPFVHSNVYAQAGLNALVAEAGVGVTMTLLNADLQLGANAGVGWFFGFYITYQVYADAALDMLDGKVYVYAKVYYPCFDPWPDICSKQWNANLWSWTGYKYNSVLFDEHEIVPLHW